MQPLASGRGQTPALSCKRQDRPGNKHVIIHWQQQYKIKICWVQDFAEPLQHCIRPHSSVISLYGMHWALNLPYKEVTELWGLMWWCKDSVQQCKIKICWVKRCIWVFCRWLMSSEVERFGSAIPHEWKSYSLCQPSQILLSDSQAFKRQEGQVILIYVLHGMIVWEMTISYL